MQPTRSTGHVPPGFARTLKPGEVPLMAGSSHNRSTEAPVSKTTKYKMMLSTAADSVRRGYHALRFKRLQQVHGRRQLQRMCLLSLVGVLGLLLLFWEQVTWPLLIQLQQLEQQHLRSLRTVTSVASSMEASAEDIGRCTSDGLKVKMFINGREVQQLDPGRRALFQEARELSREDGTFALAPNAVETDSAQQSSADASGNVGGMAFEKGASEIGFFSWLGISVAGPASASLRRKSLHSFTADQEETAMGFFEMVVNSFKVVGIPFCMGGSSLAGSLLFHAPLPWTTSLHILAPRTSRTDLGEVCKVLATSPDFVAPRAYHPTRLLRWLSESGVQFQCEETHGPHFYGRVSVDTSKAAEDLSLPPLEVKIDWYDVQTQSPKGGSVADGNDGFIVVSGASRGSEGAFTAPMNSLTPFAERPFGLLLLPAPANPTFIFNRTYKRARPFCMNRAGTGWIFGDDCRAAGKEYVQVLRRAVTESCVREDLYVQGDLRETVYIKEKFEPAPEFASWFR